MENESLIFESFDSRKQLPKNMEDPVNDGCNGLPEKETEAPASSGVSKCANRKKVQYSTVLVPWVVLAWLYQEYEADPFP